MRTCNLKSENVTLQGQPVDYIDDFCNLASNMMTNRGVEIDMNYKLNKARAELGRLQSI